MKRALDPKWGVVDSSSDSSSSAGKRDGGGGSLDTAIDRALTSGGDMRDPGAGAGGGAGGGRGAAGRGGLMGALSKGGNWWSHKISHKGPDGGEELAGSTAAHRGSLSAAKRWVGMYGGKESDLMAAANGDRETDRLAAQILKSTPIVTFI
jgi:hypothetical protein